MARIAAVVAVVAFVGVAYALPAAGATTTCAPGAHRAVIVVRPQIVVIHDTTNYGAPDQLCDRVTGKRTELDYPVIVAPHAIVVVGSRIAYAFDDNDGTTGFSGIAFANAKTGEKRLPRLQVGGHYSRFRRIVLARSGGLAWSEHGKVGYVRTCDRSCVRQDRRQYKTLASGPGVDPNSLRGVRGGIRWEQDGRKRYAPFR